MQNNENKTAKVKLKNLRLKKNNSNSSRNIFDSNIQSCSKNDGIDKSLHKKNISNSSNTEDSLADFISPKKKIVQKPNLNKLKIESNKTKKKVLKSKSNSNTKSKKNCSDVTQPLIESSFFKPQNSNLNNVKKSIPCPLCLKPFKDDITCINHMKTCASKNNISTKDLLKAKELQDRQIEERKAMGLLPTPILPEKKKVYRSKNYSTGDDPQLQLALAVSESLYQAEQKVDLEHAALLAGIPSNYIREMSDEEHRATLQNFGFTTNKPLNDFPSNRSKKRKLLGPTILQSRSKDEKDRVLTERIVCILTGDDAFTQVEENTEIIPQLNSPTILKSKFLQEIKDVNHKLWDKSKLMEEHDFYVKELKSHFLPEKNELTVSLRDSKLSTNTVNNNEKSTILPNSSVVHEIMDNNIVYDKIIEQNNSDLLTINESKNLNWELAYTNNIVFDWREGLNDRASSDTIIFVKNNKYVYVHKSVFHIRHSNILLDIQPNDTNIHPQIQNKICWPENDELSTLAFLEYIYCSNIEKNINVFDDPNLMSQVRKLGTLYPVKDLFEYLQRKQEECSARKLKIIKNISNDVNMDGYLNNINTDKILISTLTKKCNISNKEENNFSEIQPIQTLNSVTKSNLSPNLNTSMKNDKISNRNNEQNYSDREITISPDLFESENEEKNYSYKTQKNTDIDETNKDYTNFQGLKIVIDEDKNQKHVNISRPSIKTFPIKENFNEIKCIDSSQIVEISSPESDRPFILSPLEDVYKEVTPKKISPQNCDERIMKKNVCNNDQMSKMVSPVFKSSEKYDNVISKKIESEIDEIYEAVTPEYNTLSRLNDYITPKKAIYTNMIEDEMHGEENKDDNLIYTAVTPPRSNNTELNKINLDQLKTNLNLFIDRVQKQNAKNVFDTDSEVDTPDLQIRRNPFLKKDRDDSFNYLLNNKNNSPKYNKAISLIERDILDEEELNKIIKPKCNSDLYDKYLEINDSKLSQNLNVSTPKIQTQNAKLSENTTSESNYQNKNEKSTNLIVCDDEVQEFTVNETHMSIYSKYKKSNTRDNSIKKYRNELDVNNLFSNTSKLVLSENSSIATPKSITDDILVSNSDEENNTSISKIHNKSNYSFDFIENQLDQPSIHSMKKFTMLKENSKSEIIDLALHSNKNIDSQFPCNVTIDLNYSPNRSNKNKHEKFLEVSERENDDVDAEIKKILQSSPDFTSENKTILKKSKNGNQEKFNQDINKLNNSKSEIINLSPISIISSPELCELDKEIYGSKKKRRNEFDSIENKYVDEQEFNEWSAKSPQRNENVKNQNELSKSHINSNSYNQKLNFSLTYPSQNSHISHLISSPILSQNSKTNHISSFKSKLHQRQVESAKELTKKIRKLETKSASTSNCTEKIQFDKCNLQKSFSFITPEQNKKLLHKSNKYKEDITPPIDYDLLRSPDLEKELNKFGLKKQNRNKAKRLLSHIYKETHPIVALSQKRASIYNSSSEDEESLFIEQNVRKKFKKSISKENDESRAEKNIQKCAIIAEEMNYSESSTTNILENTINIKDAFFKLIETNKELHTKVLTYEPLPLEPLHLMLKENGFKCKLNNFMHFLDEQCITFQVQTDKQSHKK